MLNLRNAKTWAERFGIFIVIILFVLLKVFFLLKPHFAVWDESVYIGMGKFLFSSGASGLWEEIRPIGLPLLLGIMWKLKLDVLFFSELLAVAFAAGSVYLVYLIGKEADKRIGLAAAALLAFSTLFFSYSSSIMTEIPAAFFSLLAVYFFIRKPFLRSAHNIFLAGIFSGISFMFKFTQGLLLPAFLIVIFLNSGKWKDSFNASMKFTLGLFLVIIPFLIFNYAMYSGDVVNPFDATLRPFLLGARHQGSMVDSNIPINGGFFEKAAFYPVEIVKSNPLFAFIILGLAAVFVKREKRWGAITIILLIGLAYFTYIANKQARFALLFIPYVALLSAYGIFWLISATGKRHKSSACMLIFLVSLSAVFVLASENVKDYRWRPAEEPQIAEFYRYFEKNPVNGAVLTTDPVFAAYSDNKFIPYYDTVDIALRTYEERHKDSAAVVYTSEFIPCRIYEWAEKQSCEGKKGLLLEKIRENNELAFSERYAGQDYYIFLSIK